MGKVANSKKLVPGSKDLIRTIFYGLELDNPTGHKIAQEGKASVSSGQIYPFLKELNKMGLYEYPKNNELAKFNKEKLEKDIGEHIDKFGKLDKGSQEFLTEFYQIVFTELFEMALNGDHKLERLEEQVPSKKVKLKGEKEDKKDLINFLDKCHGKASRRYLRKANLQS